MLHWLCTLDSVQESSKRCLCGKDLECIFTDDAKETCMFHQFGRIALIQHSWIVELTIQCFVVWRWPAKYLIWLAVNIHFALLKNTTLFAQISFVASPVFWWCHWRPLSNPCQKCPISVKLDCVQPSEWVGGSCVVVTLNPVSLKLKFSSDITFTLCAEEEWYFT